MTTDQIDKIIFEYLAYLDKQNWAAADRLLGMVQALTNAHVTMPPIMKGNG